MGKILPILLAGIGLAGGIGAGVALKPPAEDALHDKAGTDETKHQEAHDVEPPEGQESDDAEYVRLNNQFVVPVVVNGRVNSLVVMSISLQVQPGTRETVFAREPKLRDAFLQVLFDHANTGGFDGMFTTSDNLRTLRMALLETSQKTLGEMISDVLIIDLVRQDT